jgi:hypothetical protein
MLSVIIPNGPNDNIFRRLPQYYSKLLPTICFNKKVFE